MQLHLHREFVSLAECPHDTPLPEVEVQAPACVDSGKCSNRQDFFELRDFSKAVDKSFESVLRDVRKARQTFERRACDYRYAQMEHKGEDMADIFGPDGPLRSGGSYLHELRVWFDALTRLYRECNRNSNGCARLIDHLRTNPDEDLGANGGHGKTGSKIYTEMRLACQVGKSRSPVPNDSPVWCDPSTGLCEQKSCRTWWEKHHDRTSDTRPWVDDREEYEMLSQACGWIGDSSATSSQINKYQQNLENDVEHQKESLCQAQFVKGYCNEAGLLQRYGECIVKTGQYCKNGHILPSSEQDETASWQEHFIEKPVKVNCTQLPMLVAFMLDPRGYRFSHPDESSKVSTTYLSTFL